MIKIVKNNNRIEIKGHSGYAEIGKDIVCSAVSTLTISTINLLDKMKFLINYDNLEGYISFNYESNDISLIIIDNMFDMLKELQEQYPKYIEIKEK